MVSLIGFLALLLKQKQMNYKEKEVLIDNTSHEDLEFLKARCEFLYKKLERYRIENILLKAVVENKKEKQNDAKKSISRRDKNKAGKD